MSDAELSTASNIVPLSSQISVPSHDTPQVDLDTGEGYEDVTGQSVLDTQNYAQESNKLSPLSFWDSKTKRVFNSLPQAAQKEWLKSFRIVEKSYAKHAQALEDSYAQLDSVAGAIAPHYDGILKAGYEPGDYIAQLIQADMTASAKPIDYVLKIMAARGVTFPMLQARVGPLLEEVKEDLKNAPLYDQLNRLEAKVDAAVAPQEEYYDEPYITPEEQSQMDADYVAQQLSSFYSQVDSSGRPLYPNADLMYNDIVNYFLDGYGMAESYDMALADRKAQIPSNSISPSINIAASGEGYSEGSRERMDRNQEKQMLKSIIEQIRSQG
jgi:hypothetical protein